MALTHKIYVHRQAPTSSVAIGAEVAETSDGDGVEAFIDVESAHWLSEL